MNNDIMKKIMEKKENNILDRYKFQNYNNEETEDNIDQYSEESSEEEIDLNYIIEECPKIDIVRNFLKEQLDDNSEDELEFLN